MSYIRDTIKLNNEMYSLIRNDPTKLKVVLVTGSSSGIGHATVILFSKLGAKVVVTGRDSARISSVAEECKNVSPQKLQALEVVADMNSESDIDRLVNETIQHYGKLDVLVNNAGLGGPSDCESPDALIQFDRNIQMNLRSVFQLCWRSKPFLEKTNGAIVNTSSICGLKPYDHSVSYCAAKAGLDMLTRSLAIRWGPKGIRVNGVNPAQVDTPIFKRDNKLPPEELEKMWKAVDNAYPLRRRGYPEDIAKAIVFLSSPDSDWITGVNLKIDGGFVDSPDLVWG